MGAPIEVRKSENPSQEDIDELHAQYVEQVVNLFEQFKGSYGWGNKKLIIK